jgi:hypothetical protein
VLLPNGALLRIGNIASHPAHGLQPKQQRKGTTMTTATEPSRARAVLSNEDFKLLQDAVVFYIKAHEDDPISSKYSNLYHRLSSAIRR